MSKPALSSSKGGIILLIVTMILLGSALRIAGSTDPLWLDETWSMLLLKPIQNIGQIFTNIHLDNNHYLNSVYLFLLGPDRMPFLYRIPSLLSGILLLILLPLHFFRKKQYLQSVIVAILLASSEFLIDLSGQARGYMPMLLCCYLSFECLDAYRKHNKSSTALLFGITALIAFLWQLTFAELYLPLFLWSLFFLHHRYKTAGTLLQKMAFLHAIPLLGLATLYWVDLRFLQIGFQRENPLLIVMIQTFMWITGTTHAKLLTAVWLVVCALYIGAMGQHMFRYGTVRQQGMFAATLVLSTLLLTFVTTGALARHFLPLCALLLLLFTYELSRAWKRSVRGQWCVVFLVAMYCAGNLYDTALLLQHGRGEAVPVLQYIAAHDSSPTIRIFTKYPPLVTNLSAYYWPEVTNGSALVIESPDDAKAAPPRWFFMAEDPYKTLVRNPGFLFGDTQYNRISLPTDPQSYWILYERAGGVNTQK